MADRDSARFLTRRQLLRYSGRLALVLPALALPWPLTPVAAAAPATGGTRAGEWAVADAVTAFTTGAGQQAQFAAPYAFDALGAHWPAGSAGDLHLAISVSADGATWSPWQLLHPDGHGVAPDPANGFVPGRTDRTFAELVQVPASRAVRCAAVDHDGQPLPWPDGLRLVYIDASAGPDATAAAPELSAFAAVATAANPPATPIVPRAKWGCDESLRFDKKGQEIWPREYYIAEKVIVHHTDTPNDQDPLQAIRAIYYYHAITKGWGDIGYNFLIDRNGVIYEGRYGGDNVVGGHALQYNYGSIGIGMIGSYTTQLDPSPTEAALIKLTAYKGRYIDPLGKYFFIDKLIPNIVGHRDVLNTSCPGDKFYPRLPLVRQNVSEVLGMTPAMNVAITKVTGADTTIFIESPYTVTVTVQNTGTSVIPSYYDKGLLYQDTDTYDSKGMHKVQGRFRITADIAGSKNAGTDAANPWRWGFGRSINPGETVDVPCRVVFTTSGQKQLQFGLVQELVGYKQQGLAGPTITVISPVDPEPAPAETSDTLIYFPETQHTLRGALLRYWQKFGGLAQFGYPLTSEFAEISDSDKNEYTVQYFERARFEYHPENKGTDFEVLLGLVGRQFHPLDKPAAPITDGTHAYFKETGHNLGGGFQAYWEQYGGLFVYGYPLTEEIAEISRVDNKAYTVQYFERARFEYHPENTGKSRVLLGLLGRQMLQDRGWLN
jgi:hypothetical protein